MSLAIWVQKGEKTFTTANEKAIISKLHYKDAHARTCKKQLEKRAKLWRKTTKTETK